MRAGMADMVVGRADEVRLLDAFLADPAPEPRALLIEGEPGIGKTTLLQGLLSIASERGYPVLSCRPARSEMDLSYVGLVELLAGVDEAVVDALRAVAADGPVLVAVDDTQWLDHPSARTLAFALRRLAGTPVRVALVRSFSAPQRGLEPPRPGGVVDWPIEVSRTMTPG